MAKFVDLQISNLRLDYENPRISTDEGQINIRQALLDDQGSKIAELALDIAEHGLNPMDRMMVLQPDPKENEFIALEGNRRTAALQILANPSLLEDLTLPDALRDKLTELADKFDPKVVEPISAVVMSDRDTARRWIELRHTGQNDGRGIVNWNGVQTARFRGDRTLDLIEFVKQKGSLTDAELSVISNDFPITTLDRIVSNPSVRKKIGLQIIDGEYFYVYPIEEQVKILKKIILDLGSKSIKVDSVKSKDQQISYVDSIPDEFVPKGLKLDNAASLSDSLKAKSKPSAASARTKIPLSPLNRTSLVPKTFVLNLSNSKALQLFHELRELNIDKFPISCAIAFRSFVEAVVVIYCEKNSLDLYHKSGKNQGKELYLSEKVSEAIKHLSNILSKQEITAANANLVNPNSVISISRLNEYVHNPQMFPSKGDLISGWSGAEAFLRAVCK